MKTVRVSAAVICREGKLFAVQRGYGEYKDGWEFPGGKIEEGENPAEAAVREIREELDLEIKPIMELACIEYDYEAFHLSMHCILAVPEGNSLHLNEHEAMRWLADDDLYEPDWLPADLELIGIIKEKYGGAAGIAALAANTTSKEYK